MVKTRTCFLIQPVTYLNSSDIYSVYGQNQNMYSYSTGHFWNGCRVELTERLEKLQRGAMMVTGLPSYSSRTNKQSNSAYIFIYTHNAAVRIE